MNVKQSFKASKTMETYRKWGPYDLFALLEVL